MAAVLQFRSDIRRNRREPDAGANDAGDAGAKGQVIIFPGVRIERIDLDLSHRLVQVPATVEGVTGSPAGNP